MILLDTDICLSLLAGKINFREILGSSGESVSVSSITAGELFLASNKSQDPAGNRVLVEKFLLTVQILHQDLSISKYIADVQHSLLRKGKKATYADIVIFSTAKVYEARLVTGNGKRYCFT
jgi:predicted nucleic acid-binding protein